MFNRVLGALFFVFTFLLTAIEPEKSLSVKKDLPIVEVDTTKYTLAEIVAVDAVKSFYTSIEANGFEMPSYDCFQTAFIGYESLNNEGEIKNEKLVLVDFSESSNQKRFWVVDMLNKKVLYQSLVSHGMNTGEEYASNFSNAHNSHKSSLGFYLTGETYISAKNGFSLRIDGLEKGINDNARDRGVVIHAADYVSKQYIKDNKRLGRSYGCPALPEKINKEVINIIKNKACLFIYHPSRKYSPKTVSKL